MRTQSFPRHAAQRDTITDVADIHQARPARVVLHAAASLAVLCTLFTLAGCHATHGADVVASVNGHAIPRADLDRLFDTQQKNKQDPAPESPEQADSERLEIARGLIDEEIVEQRAAKMNLTATNDEVDAKIAEFKSHYTDQDFNEYLKQSNQTLDDFRRNVRRSVTSTKLFNKEIESKINVTDAEVTNYFNAHKADYNLIESRYHLAQILVTAVPMDRSQGAQPNLQGSKAANEADAKKKIQSLKNRIDAGEDFGTLAANFSENPQTAANGGDMGFPSESQLRADPQTFAAIGKLKAGETTDILPVSAGNGSKQVIGYVILKLLARESAGQRDLTDPRVQQGIRDQLRNSRGQLLKSAYLEMVRDQAKVENYLAEQVFNNKGAK